MVGLKWLRRNPAHLTAVSGRPPSLPFRLVMQRVGEFCSNYVSGADEGGSLRSYCVRATAAACLQPEWSADLIFMEEWEGGGAGEKAGYKEHRQQYIRPTLNAFWLRIQAWASVP